MRIKHATPRKICHYIPVIGACFAATAVYPQKFGVEDDLRAVVTATDAYVPQPAQIIAPGNIKFLQPDPHGRFALVSQFAPMGRGDMGEVNLLLYDSHTGRVKTIWNQPAPEKTDPTQGEVNAARWFPDGDVAIAAVSMNKFVIDPTGLLRNTATTGALLLIHAAPTSRKITTVLQGNFIVTGPSRASGIAVVQVWDPLLGESKVQNVHFMTVDSLGRTSEISEINGRSYGLRNMSADGRSLYFYPMPHPGQSYAEYEKDLHYLKIDLQTRSTSDATLADAAESESTVRPAHIGSALRLVSGDLVARSPSAPTASGSDSFTTRLKPLYLVRADGKADKSHLPGSVMIAPHADSSLLLADNSAVLYQFQRTLYAAPLVRMPLPDYSQRVREEAIAGAKSIGTAMSMYAQDYDGFLPPAAAPTGMSPYLRNADAFSDPSTGTMGFRYLLDGQSQAGMKGADSRVAGYLDCVFGRATIYADGHVTWTDTD